MNKIFTRILIMIGFLLLLSRSEAQQYDWMVSAGNNNSVENNAKAVCIDRSHHIISSGNFFSHGTFSGIPQFAIGKVGIFLCKQDTAGHILWLKTIGGDSTETATSVATDASNNIFITGNCNSPVIYFSASDSIKRSYKNVQNSFVAKYDSSGRFIWARLMEGENPNQTLSLTLDPLNNVIIGGSYDLALKIGSEKLDGGAHNMFLAKFDNDGNLLWVKPGKSGNTCFIKALTTDASGNIYGTGKISGDVAFKTDELGYIYDLNLRSTSIPPTFVIGRSGVTLTNTPGGMLVTGGTDNIFENIYYNSNSNLENFKFESHLKATRGGSGIGLGKYCGNFALATFGLSDTGENHITGWWYSPIPISASYHISLDDSVHIVLERKYDTLYAMIENYSGHYTVSTGYRFSQQYPLWTNTMVNSGVYAMYFMGGSQTVYDLKLSSTDNSNTLCTFVGNSITAGYFSGGMGHRYQDLLYRGNPYAYTTNSGPGDYISNVLNDSLEIIRLHSKYVFLDIGVNDARVGADTNNFESQYRLMVLSFKRHGIIPIAALLTPVGTSNIPPYNRRIQSVASSEGLTVVDFWHRLVDSTSEYMKSTYDVGDNVHPNTLGHIKMAEAVASDAPFLLSDIPAWDSLHGVTTTEAEHDKLYVMKYDANGNFHWLHLDTTQTASNSSAGDNFSCGASIALGAGDDIYVGGNILLASYPAAGSIVNIQAAVLDKFQANGTPVWQKQFGADAINSIQGVCTAENGECYVIGNYGGYLNLGGTALTPADFSNVFMAKFDQDGAIKWSTNATGYAQFSSGIALDRSDSTLAFVGNYNDSASFGPISLHTSSSPSFTNYDAFIGRLSDRLLPTSISTITSSLTFSIYPNPGAELLNMSLPEEGLYDLRVINCLGQEYFAKQEVRGLLQLDINTWEKGIYIIQISDAKQHSNTCKFVKM